MMSPDQGFELFDQRPQAFTRRSLTTALREIIACFPTGALALGDVFVSFPVALLAREA